MAWGAWTAMAISRMVRRFTYVLKLEPPAADLHLDEVDVREAPGHPDERHAVLRLDPRPQVDRRQLGGVEPIVTEDSDVFFALGGDSTDDS